MPHPLFGNVQPVSFQLLDKFWPGEIPIIGGSAKSAQLDRELLDTYLQSGGARPRRVNALEADWLASAIALYYVTPGLRLVLRWAWTDIRMVTLIKQRGMYATLRVDFNEDAPPVLMEVGRSSASRLLAFQEQRTPSGFDAPANEGAARPLNGSSRAGARVARRWGLSEEDLTEQRVEALVHDLRTLPEDNPMRLQAEEHYEVILPAHLEAVHGQKGDREFKLLRKTVLRGNRRTRLVAMLGFEQMHHEAHGRRGSLPRGPWRPARFGG